MFARKRFDGAIAEYTKALQSKPNFPLFLMSRAMAYEAKGDRARAIADYCKILVVYSTRNRRAVAMERIAQLTQPQQHGTNVPFRVPMAADSLAKPGLPAPATGDLQKRHGRNGIAPFSIQTNSGSNYLVKLVNVANSKDQIWVFVRGGEPYSTKVPIGNYSLRVASGSTWYGREELFGPDTRFFRLRGKKRTTIDQSLVLAFKKERSRIVGHTLSFEGSVEGNMEQEAMTRSEFDAN
ncbi:tetratricopeptide repeat protein [Bradyrhizobium liaoningense]|uniref:hypothetical protein n=1 Tax=Bradyrhizobium liaoningense TaxID=43992 RepID=UPI0012FD689F|nr:hypothetical protein [Bradyrhizobium liaoningense]